MWPEEQEKKQASTAKAVLQAASRRAPLTAEERQRKLLEMQAAADAHDARIAADARMAKALDAEDNNDEGQSNVAPHFIKYVAGVCGRARAVVGVLASLPERVVCVDKSQGRC